MTLTPLLPLCLAAAGIALPGRPPVSMDYLAYDRATNRVWVPAGNTGKVDVVDAATDRVVSLDGFATAPARRPDRPRVGPSSATVAEGAVWVGNRGDNRLTSFDAKTLARGATVALSVMPDGLAYVARTHELWVTTPREQAIQIIAVGGKAPGKPAALKLAGDPEGYAVDEARGLFYTNLENRDETLAIDIEKRAVVATWPSGCGAEGPRGLALDGARRLLFVACTDGARVLDVAHEGRIVGRIKTGGGVDNLDYDATSRRLFVASPRDGKMTIAHVADGGVLEAVTVVPTAPGARNPIVDARGRVYVEDSLGGRLIVVEPPAR